MGLNALTHEKMRSILVPLALLLVAGCGGGAAATPPPPASPASPASTSATTTVATPAPAQSTASASVQPNVPDVPAMTSSGATLTWYGHAAFKLVTPSGKVIWFDPWVTNPKNPTGKDDLAKIDKGDLILISHGHFDHVGDAVAITRRRRMRRLVTTFDLGRGIASITSATPKQKGRRFRLAGERGRRHLLLQ